MGTVLCTMGYRPGSMEPQRKFLHNLNCRELQPELPLSWDITTLHYRTLHYNKLHHTILYYTTLHYITLHNTTQILFWVGSPQHTPNLVSAKMKGKQTFEFPCSGHSQALHILHSATVVYCIVCIVLQWCTA